MAPPPPASQAGRFKPRKPAKSIQTPGLTEANQGGQQQQAGPGGGGGRFPRGGGSGRGGRSNDDGRGRGRGRGRFNIPQGQVFFTASPAGGRAQQGIGGVGGGRVMSEAERRRLVASGRAQRRTNGPADLAKSNEEIVGTLEEGIGSMAVPTSVLSNNSDFITSSTVDSVKNAFERALLGEEFDGGVGKPITMSGADLYDTDTSDDEGGRQFNKGNNNNKIRKTDLIKPVSLSSPEPRHGTDATTATSTSTTNQSTTNHLPSPFVTTNDADALRNEKHNFFLVQLPTRLPPITMMDSINQGGGTAADEGGRITASQDSMLDELAQVATPSLQTNTFDNVLSQAVSGRIGKIKIYKSGRTVLIFESPDGQPAVEMKVSEGISCGFKQHAVSIDLEKGTFLPLGNVGKTIVVTPDLTQPEQHL